MKLNIISIALLPLLASVALLQLFVIETVPSTAETVLTAVEPTTPFREIAVLTTSSVCASSLPVAGVEEESVGQDVWRDLDNWST